MCGVIGVFGTPYSSQEVYQGLQLLQHRGQDAAGILSYNSLQKNFNLFKDTGLVSSVFSSDILAGLSGDMSIGHTRYATIGPKEESAVISKSKSKLDAKRDLQPMMLNHPFGMGMIHNGNLVNYHELKEKLKSIHERHLFTQNDLEVLLNLLSLELIQIKQNQEKNDLSTAENFNFEDLILAVHKIFDQALGGYSVLGLIAEKGFFAFRDPHGLRPLILGRRKLTESEKNNSSVHFDYSYCLSSESNALNFLGYESVRDIAAGEVLFIDYKGKLWSSFDKETGYSKYVMQNQSKPAACMFEYIYFSNPESELDQISVYGARLRMGQHMAEAIQKKMESHDIKIDMIVPIPETSRVAAIALSEKLKIPYREVLIKNRYIQRSFILNTQESRKRAVQLKLTAIKSEIKGKNILLIDDSVVRGTTSKQIVDLVREAGAHQIYFASTSPPIRQACYYGIDFPNPTELVAYNRTIDEISKTIGVDQMFYLSEEDLQKSISSKKKLCMACINGCYPVKTDSHTIFKNKRSNTSTNTNTNLRPL